MHSSDELEEERRLMYVACTRARERLYLSSYADSGEEFSALAGNQAVSAVTFLSVARFI